MVLNIVISHSFVTKILENTSLGDLYNYKMSRFDRIMAFLICCVWSMFPMNCGNHWAANSPTETSQVLWPAASNDLLRPLAANTSYGLRVWSPRTWVIPRIVSDPF